MTAEQEEAACNALSAVFAERLRQEDLRDAGRFAWTCSDPTQLDSEKLAILTEEVGEVAREICEMITTRDFEKVIKPESYRNLRNELVQVAACAVAWVEALDVFGVK